MRGVEFENKAHRSHNEAVLMREIETIPIYKRSTADLWVQESKSGSYRRSEIDPIASGATSERLSKTASADGHKTIGCSTTAMPTSGQITFIVLSLSLRGKTTCDKSSLARHLQYHYASAQKLGTQWESELFGMEYCKHEDRAMCDRRHFVSKRLPTTPDYLHPVESSA